MNASFNSLKNLTGILIFSTLFLLISCGNQAQESSTPPSPSDSLRVSAPSSAEADSLQLLELDSLISEASKEYSKEVAELKDFLLQAKAYDQNSSDKKHLPFAAAKGIFDGSQKLYINASKSKEIIDAINMTQELGISNVIIVGGEEAHEHIDLLVKNNIPVLVKRLHSLPDTDDDDYDISFKRASLLHKGGVLVALENSGGMERMNGRNLPFYAGTATAHGLSNEEALQLISSNPAKILGIEANYGTLEVGKSATLFISEGDALDMRTNQLTEAFIDGRRISLETHQTKLWKRYMGKYSAE